MFQQPARLVEHSLKETCMHLQWLQLGFLGLHR